VLALPGHTPGSIGLLIEEDRLLLAGDTLSPQCCIFFQESLPLEVCRQTIHSLWEQPFDHFLSSHFDILFDKETIRKFEACFDLIGVKRGMDYLYQILPEERGRFFVLSPRDPELNTMVGLAVKNSDVPALDKKGKTDKIKVQK
jgi:glyoxylase-like metal-dependent hydrolase (beta-lactamase superfamily II)